MTNFAIICSTKISSRFGGITEVLIHYVTNRGKPRVMLRIGAGHSDNHQIIT